MASMLTHGLRRFTPEEIEANRLAAEAGPGYGNEQFSQTQKAIAQGEGQFGSTYEGLGAVTNALIGNEAGAREGLRRKAIEDQYAADMAPDVNSVGDVHSAADTVAYVRNTALTQLPNILSTIGGGGVGGYIGKRMGLRYAQKKLIGSVEQAAAEKLAAKGATAATSEVAKLQAREAALKLAGKSAAGKALTRAAAGQGSAGGVAATSVALETGSLADSLEDKKGTVAEGGVQSTDTMQQRALKVAGGGTIAGLIDALPAYGLLRKAGLAHGLAGQEIKALAGKMSTRLMREAGKQAVEEGGTELAQTIIERASRKWIDDRVGMLSPDAYEEYLNATVAGATLGGLGGGMSVFPRSVQQALTRRPKKSSGDAATDVANASKLLAETNGTVDLNDDTIHDEEDDGSFDGHEAFQMPGQQPSPNPETAAEMAHGIPTRMLAMLRDPRTTPELRAAIENKIDSISQQREASAAAGAEKSADATRAELATLMDGNPAGGEAIQKLFRGRSKTLVDEVTDKTTQWHPSQSLLSAVIGRPSLTGDEVASIRQLDDKLSTPDLRRRAFEMFSGTSGASEEEQRAVRSDVAKGGGVKVEDRALASTMRADSSARWLQDRTLRSALRDLSGDGDVDATDALNELEDETKKRIGREQSVKHRTTLGDQVYATALGKLQGTELGARVQAKLNESYEGMPIDEAARVPSRDATAPERELQVVDPQGKEHRVDVPHLINLVQSNSAASWGSGDVLVRQVGEAYAKALEVLKTQGDRVAKPKAMGRDNLLLYRDKKTGQKITLGDVRAKGYFGTAKKADGSIDASDEAIYNEFDPADIKQPTVSEHVDDNRVPGGDTFLPAPKRPIAPQEDVLEALTGAPPARANARIEAKPKGLADITVDTERPRGEQIIGEAVPPRERSFENEIDDAKLALQQAVDRHNAMTPKQRGETGIAKEVAKRKAELQQAYKRAKQGKAKRGYIKKSATNILNRIVKKATPVAKKPFVPKPAASRAELDEVDKRRLARQARLAAAKDARDEAKTSKVTGKTVAETKPMRKPNKGSKRDVRDKAGVAKAEAALAKAAEHSDKAAAQREKDKAPASATQKQMLMARIEAMFPKAVPRYEAMLPTMTVGELMDIRARLDKATRANDSSYDDKVDPSAERATPRIIRHIDSLARGKAPNVASLNRLTKNLLDHFGLSGLDVKIDLAPANNLIGFGRVVFTKDGAIISLRETLRGKDLISSLSHELGHVIQRHMTRTASPETQAALMDAYQKWLKGNPKTRKYYDVLNSRAPAARQKLFEEMNLLGTGKEIGELDADAQAYATLYDEWFADQVARYITTDVKTVGLVGKVYAKTAKILRELANLFARKALPDKTVKKYLDSLRPTLAQRAQAKRQLDATGSIDPKRLPGNIRPAQAAAAITAMVTPGTTQSVTTIIDNFRRLPIGAKAILNRVLTRGPMIAKLRTLVRDPVTLAAMEDPRVGMETRMAVAFEAWRLGVYEPSAAQGAFRKVWSDVLGTIGVLTESDYFEQFLTDSLHEKVGNPERYDLFRRSVQKKSALAQSIAELDRYYRGSVMPAAEKYILGGVADRLRAMNIPEITDVVTKFKAASGDRLSDIGLFPARHREANRLNSSFGRAIEGLGEHDLDALHAVLTGAEPASSLTTEQAAALPKIRAHFDSTYDYLREAGVEFSKKKDYFPMVMKDPSELAQNHEEFVEYFAKNFEPQMRAKLLKLWTEGLDPKNRVDAEKIKQINKELNGPKKKSAAELAESFYAMASGDDASDTSAPEWVRKGNKPSFRYMNEQLMDFVNAAPADVRKQFDKFREPNLAYTVTRYNEAAAKRAEFQRRFPDEPGDEDNPPTPALAAAFERAKKQGATPEQLEQLQDYIDVMMGSYGLAYPKALKSLLGGMDKVFGTKLADNPAAMRKLQGFIVVYQNIRLLGLATLSSLVDSFGIAIRSGGKFDDAFRAYRDSFKSIRKEGSMSEMWKLAEDLGVVETTATNEALAAAYGGLYLSRGARQVNDFFFKAIGLTRWTQATRVASVAMANRFMIRHGTEGGVNKHSKRYMEELGLKPGDIEADGDFVELHSGDAARDARVRDAMLRFVDESILRPDPSQRPLWASDPNYMLMSQYKSFTYAFQSTILKRIGHEFREGNYQPLMMALAYLPVMLAAELLREFIQYGEEGNPNRENWGAPEYFGFTAKRTGLLGPKEYITDAMADPSYGRLPGTSFLGPTASQARDLMGGRKPMNKKMLEATPFQSVTKHHVDLDPVETAEATPRGAAEVVE